MTTVILLFLAGVIGGGLGSILGLGGGVILVPALTIVFGYPIQTAIGVSLIGVVATSAGGTAEYQRQGHTNIRLGLTLELATVLGAFIGAFTAAWVNPKYLYFLFSFTLLYNAYSMIRSGRSGKARKGGTASPEESQETYQVKNLPLGMVLALAAGILSGLLGIGGGIIKVPLMYFLMGLPLKAAAATSNLMVGITAGSGAFVYILKGLVVPGVVVPVALGVLAGASFGSRLVRKLSALVLQRIFMVVFLIIAIQMVWKGLKM